LGNSGRIFRCFFVRTPDGFSYERDHTTRISFTQRNCFCGGSALTNDWLTRDSLLGILSDLGLNVVIGEDKKDHPNGPASLASMRRHSLPLHSMCRREKVTSPLRFVDQPLVEFYILVDVIAARLIIW